MTLRERTCCFTGHRNIPKDQYPVVRKLLKDVLHEMVEEGVIYYGAGGALGFDTLAAQCVLDMKKEFPQIKLILVLPCVSQAAKWGKRDQDIYESIRARADKCRYVSHEYTRDCMYRRNRHLVDNSGTCICYLTRNRGGTAYTIDYAKRNGLHIINLAGGCGDNAVL